MTAGRKIVVGLVVVAAGVWAGAFAVDAMKAGRESQAQAAGDFEADVHAHVVADALAQYDIAERNGTEIDAYVRAGLVAEAYLQAHDEANYSKWKTIVAEHAEAAGMPDGTY